MPTEAWRLALARWGDPAWTLAILMMGQHEAAQTTVVDVFCHMYRDGTPDDPEHSLYRSLAQRRVRFDRIRRRPSLHPALRHIGPTDRLLLGLWLLRDQNGAQLSAITGESVPTLTTRLVSAITTWTKSRRTVSPHAVDQVELAELVTEHLSATPSGSKSTRPHAYAGQTTIIDEVRAELHEITHTMHLPPECPAHIEACLMEQQQATSTRWWQRSAVWQVGLVGLTIALLVLLIVPRGNTRPQQTAGSVTAESLVRVALERWSATTDQIIYRRVWATDPLGSQADAVVTDVWLAAGDSAEHRIEVHRGKQLTEWQIADGNRRLNYGTIPAESACPWTLSHIANTPVAFSYRVPAHDQLEARDARLQQGAYGLGYLALQRALAAPDLRSFGTRVVASRTFVTLIYSDTYWGPSQQVVLRIDPVSGELYGVQTVSISGAQTRTRDLWRVDVRENVEFIPSPLPPWNEGERLNQLIDPGCLMLKAGDVQELRTTLDTDETRWYLSAALPAGIVRGALIAPAGRSSADAHPEQHTAQFSGPGRFLALSPVSWQPNIAGTSERVRGKWRIASRAQDGAELAHLTLHLQHEHNAGVFPQLGPDATGWSLEETLDSFVITIDIAARGWTEDELLRFVDQLEPASPAQWVGLRDHFVSAQPLNDTVRTAVDEAIRALEAPAEGTIITSAQTTTRTRPPPPPLDDPYHIAYDLWVPESTQLRQTLVYTASNVMHFDDQRVTNNNMLYVGRWSDGTRFVFGNHAQGWAFDGNAAQLGAAAYPVQPGIAMLAAVLQGSRPIVATEQADALMIETQVAWTQEDLISTAPDTWNVTPWIANLPAGTITYRVWLDRVTSLPQRMELVHDNQQTRLLETVITERRVTNDGPAASPLVVPVVEGDMLLFHWQPGTGLMLDEGVFEGMENTPPFIWTEAVGVAMQWQLEPVGMGQPLSLSAFKAARWFNLSRLSTVHRALYRVGEANNMSVLVTQGPKNIMRHVIRYSESMRGADAMPWTFSNRLTVTVNGLERSAWLLAHNEVAALVIELDDRLIHVMGLRSYLEGAELQKLITQLNATAP